MSTPHSRARWLWTAALWLVAVSAARAESPPVYTVGEGESVVQECTRQGRVLAVYRGFGRPTDIHWLDGDRFLVVDEYQRTARVFSAVGELLDATSVIDGQLIRARPRADGGLLLVYTDRVTLRDASGEIVWTLPGASIRDACLLADGNVLLATQEYAGSVAVVSPQGAVVWSSTEGTWLAPGETSQPTRRRPEKFFGLDQRADGTILATDPEVGRHFLLSPDWRVLRFVSVPTYTVGDARFGPGGEIVGCDYWGYRVWVLAEGTAEGAVSFETEHPPSCVTMTPRGTLLVGMVHQPEAGVFNATALRQRQPSAYPWYERPLPLPLLTAAAALLVALAARRPWRRAAPTRTQAESAALPPALAAHWPLAARATTAVVGAGAVAAAAWGCWRGWDLIHASGWTPGLAWFLTAAVAGAAALKALAWLFYRDADVTRFTYRHTALTPQRGDIVLTVALAAVAAACAGGSLYGVIYLPQQQAAAVALWVAAQILILAAAAPGLPRAPEEAIAHRHARPWLIAVLLAAVVLHFAYLGWIPDHYHHDHANYGFAAYKVMQGDNKGFFIMEPWMGSGFARPWLIPQMAVFQWLGMSDATLRLTAAVWGVIGVGAVYLLGRALYTPRVGLIAALLVLVNHVMLLFARQPYVIESTAPFWLGLYFLVEGLKRGCRLSWTLAGFWMAWSMLSIRQCTTFPFIGGVFFLYMLIFHARWLWRRRGGLIWFVLGMTAVYLPMIPGMLAEMALKQRLADVAVLLTPDGGFVRDAALWYSQLERAFGVLLRYPDNSPWSIAAQASTCLRYDAWLFGTGLAYMLGSWRTPATALLWSILVVSIFLGSAMLPTPPSSYHHFVAFAPIGIAAALALDRMLALTAGLPRAGRAAAWAVAAVLLALICRDHLQTLGSVILRPPRYQDRAIVYHATPDMMAARVIRRHPEFRYYYLRTRYQRSCADTLFCYAVVESDISDVTQPLERILPVPPLEFGRGACFLVQTPREAEVIELLKTYPGASLEEFLCRAPDQKLIAVWVDVAELASVYEQMRAEEQEP